ncbi:hypothetical protein N0V83_008209 [Neocucurbitaria cava]|uniref:Calcineurin-like phosphoesterase domain-containing protein n=1 Tax=Neocucurbitaria cava TaxID=798079 RepID=A0A9W8Y1J4_9PLEO|nr:hypothetical protein N0V83_008209 [Neocucurbitaria cava]
MCSSRLSAALWGLVTATVASAQSLPGSKAYTAPAGFPTSAFSSYYLSPAKPTAEPQPALYDAVLNLTYPSNLTNPYTIPQEDNDPIFYPSALANLSDVQTESFVSGIISQVSEIIDGSNVVGNCSKCIAALSVARSAAVLVPEALPEAMVSLCKKYKFHDNETCEEDFEASTFGAVWVQILRYADVGGWDGCQICNSLSSNFCPRPYTLATNTTDIFPKPKPANATAPKASGKRVKVLHMSDFHLDPRFAVGSEANCTTSLCCRANNNNTALHVGQISLPATPYGNYKCDSPYNLGLAALQAVGPLTGTSKSNPLAWTVYTGDLVSHEGQNELSRLYVEYTEDSVYGMLKTYVTGPVFTALGNHDSNPEAIDSPHKLPGPLGQQQSWNYDHVAGLWQNNGWISKTQADEARLHYGGYSIKNQYGLRVITFNTDFWYRSNFLTYINTTQPDNSGMFSWMISELQAAEDAGERVWIVGHVLSGWDGSNPIPNPTDLFYQIIDRYSPHVIANVFFGHTHEDQVMVYYANNGTSQTAGNALTSGWIGPSVTPLTNLNSGFRLYEVDTGDFNIYDAWTFTSPVNSYANLTSTGPTYSLEYSTRDAYGPGANWPATAPLNATFWHRVTEAMEQNRTLVSLFNTYQGKSSVQSPNSLGQSCPQGFGSVQSAYTGKNF